MQLAQDITDYYFTHLHTLEDDKQFHFCSRLAAWSSNKKAKEYLTKVRNNYVPNPCTKTALTSSLRNIIEHPPVAPVNARTLRTAYFDKYPSLRPIDFALFRVRHLLEIYGVDARPALFDIITRKELLQLHADLLADPQALSILSTYAINYIYLLEHVILEFGSDLQTSPEYFYDLSDMYDLNDPDHLQLLIYLYTHCIIGETNFYAKDVPAGRMPTYQKMLTLLEECIVKHFESINLDNKLEFLVCCRIINYRSPLFDRIYRECSRSISTHGTFLVDTYNSRAQRDRITANGSEHRNVLFILSTTPYAPQPIGL